MTDAEPSPIEALRNALVRQDSARWDAGELPHAVLHLETPAALEKCPKLLGMRCVVSRADGPSTGSLALAARDTLRGLLSSDTHDPCCKALRALAGIEPRERSLRARRTNAGLALARRREGLASTFGYSDAQVRRIMKKECWEWLLDRVIELEAEAEAAAVAPVRVDFSMPGATAREVARKLAQFERERETVRRLVAIPTASFKESLGFFYVIGSTDAGDSGRQRRVTTVNANQPPLRWRTARIASYDPQAIDSLRSGAVSCRALDAEGEEIPLIQTSSADVPGLFECVAIFPRPLQEGETLDWTIYYEWPGFSARLRETGSDFHRLHLTHPRPSVEFRVDLPPGTSGAHFLQTSPADAGQIEETTGYLRWWSKGEAAPGAYRWEFAADIPQPVE